MGLKPYANPENATATKSLAVKGLAPYHRPQARLM